MSREQLHVLVCMGTKKKVRHQLCLDRRAFCADHMPVHASHSEIGISSIAGGSNSSIKIISSSNRNSSHSRASDSDPSEGALQVQTSTMTTTAAVNAAAVHEAAAATGDKEDRAGWHTRDSDRDMMLLLPTRPNEVRWAVTPQVFAG